MGHRLRRRFLSARSLRPAGPQLSRGRRRRQRRVFNALFHHAADRPRVPCARRGPARRACAHPRRRGAKRPADRHFLRQHAAPPAGGVCVAARKRPQPDGCAKARLAAQGRGARVHRRQRRGGRGAARAARRGLASRHGGRALPARDAGAAAVPLSCRHCRQDDGTSDPHGDRLQHRPPGGRPAHMARRAERAAARAAGQPERRAPRRRGCAAGRAGQGAANGGHDGCGAHAHAARSAEHGEERSRRAAGQLRRRDAPPARARRGADAPERAAAGRKPAPTGQAERGERRAAAGARPRNGLLPRRGEGPRSEHALGRDAGARARLAPCRRRA